MGQPQQEPRNWQPEPPPQQHDEEEGEEEEEEQRCHLPRAQRILVRVPVQ